MRYTAAFLTLSLILLGGQCGSPRIEEPTPVTLLTETITESTDLYDINVSYPQIGVSAIDADLYGFSQSLVNDFKTQFIGEELFSPFKNSLDITFEAQSLNSDIASFVFLMSMYTGGAHGNQFYLTKNYDVASATVLELEDLFQEDAEYVSVLSAMSIESLRGQFSSEPDEDWLSEGAGVQKENFSEFSIGKEAIHFHFSPYEVGPYAEGGKEAILQKSDLQDYLKPAFQ